MRRSYILLLAVLLLAAFLRFWQLGVVPKGVTHDEIGYIYNAYSLAKTGANVNSESPPFLTWLTSGFPYMPVPIYLSAPIFWFFPLSPTSGRLLAAIFGTVGVLLLYLLVKRLFRSEPLALLSALFLAISPWHTFISRTAYDTNTSSFFYLLGILLFIWEIEKRRLPLLSLVSFWLAIFSYRGMNPVFPGLVILLLWYGWTELKITKKQILIFFIGVCIIITTVLITAYQNAHTGYVSEAFTTYRKMQEDLDNWIREAEGPLFVRRLFLNKPTYILSRLRENYLDAYSPSFLFLRGESDPVTSIWSRGKLYSLDALFIVLGMYCLFKRNRRASLFVLLLLLIGGFPGMVGGSIYASRNFMLAYIFPVLSAGGVFFALKAVGKFPFKIAIAFCIFLAYLYLLGGFLFDYYGRYANGAAEPWFKSVKDISLLIGSENTQYSKVIVGTSSVGELLQYAFYNKIDPSVVQKSLKQADEKTNTSSIYNITFTGKCLESEDKHLPSFIKVKPLLYIVHENCAKMATPSSVIKDHFGNTVWKVYRIQKHSQIAPL